MNNGTLHWHTRMITNVYKAVWSNLIDGAHLIIQMDLSESAKMDLERPVFDLTSLRNCIRNAVYVTIANKIGEDVLMIRNNLDINFELVTFKEVHLELHFLWLGDRSNENLLNRIMKAVGIAIWKNKS